MFSFWVFYETADPSSLTLEINTNGSSNIFIRKCALVEWDSLYWRDLLISTVIPFILMILFTILTIVKIYSSRKRIKRKSPNHPELSLTKQQKDVNNLRKRDIRFAITSVTLNLVFLFFYVPFSIWNIVGYYVIVGTDDVYYFMDTITLWLTYVDAGSVFYINLAFNTLFRDELYSLFNINRNAE